MSRVLKINVATLANQMSHLQDVLSQKPWHILGYIKCTSDFASDFLPLSQLHRNLYHNEHSISVEDGKGTVVDEYGRPEPMDYITTSYTQYLSKLPQERDNKTEAMQIEDDAKAETEVAMREASIKRNYTLYTDQDKARFFKLLFEKCLSASAAAKQLGIHVRTARRWAKQYERDPDSIFQKHRKTGRPRLLNEEHKEMILDCIDENPSAVLEQVMEQLRQLGFSLYTGTAKKKSKSAWIGFMARSKKDSPAVVRVPKTRAQTTTILGAISAAGLIKCSLRLPQPPANKKRKRGDDVACMSKATGYYLVMDNALIHTYEDIAKYIASRGYRCAYLPSYSPELNPVEQFWSVVKSEVKRNKFLEKDIDDKNQRGF
ncbi:hypothetical protein VTP01DRAFT_7241 [Rhizomucor pusillus]|uniref:uncharacterized protein n=1 Tax=Rhizomucor pusillus TaxID=4840 RepID=UPI003742D6C6